ncbi:MAG: hypothetical protein KA042_10790, partial [Saprospiraceae bacterium]|nr:hypothetical protein [Saprospiraceae bacterium]
SALQAEGRRFEPVNSHLSLDFSGLFYCFEYLLLSYNILNHCGNVGGQWFVPMATKPATPT